MTYLELCNKVREKCAISGGDLPSVENQVGTRLKVVNWVNDAYEDIQRLKKEWLFRQADKTFQTITGVDSYTSEMSNVSEIRFNSVTSYTTSIGVADELELDFLHYDDFRRCYQIGSQNDARPLHYSIGNDRSLLLGPKPNVIYAINFQYTQKIQSLSENTSEPIIPDDYQMAIVWKAAMYYAGHEEAPEQFQVFNRYYLDVLKELNEEQLNTEPFEMETLA